MSDHKIKLPPEFFEENAIVPNDMVRNWLEALENTIPSVEEEIDQVKGAISNERLWSQGSRTPDQVSMHQENVRNLCEYLKCLKLLLAKLGEEQGHKAERYEVMCRVDGCYYVNVVAHSPREAKELAEDMASDADFGELDCIDCEVLSAKDSRGMPYDFI